MGACDIWDEGSDRDVMMGSVSGRGCDLLGHEEVDLRVGVHAEGGRALRRQLLRVEGWGGGVGGSGGMLRQGAGAGRGPVRRASQGL